MEFIDLKEQYKILKSSLSNKIFDILDKGNYIMGPDVFKFEADLANYLEMKHVITCANGTDALILALKALNLQSDEVVLLPSFTFAATAEAVAHLKGIPFFVDVDINTYNIFIDSLEEGYQNAILRNLKPVGVISVDLFGSTCQHSLIQEFCKNRNIWYIIDAAQACGAKHQDKFNCHYSDITTTSFFPAKPLGCYGDGGAIFTNSQKHADKIRSLRVHGKGENKYENIYIGMNSRLDTIQAAVLNEKLKIYNSELEKRNSIAMQYNKFLDKIEEIHLPKCNSLNFTEKNVWAQYTLRAKKRDLLRNHLAQCEIPSMVYYPKPLHLQKAYEKYPRLNILINSEILSQEVLSLPMHPYLQSNSISKIVSAINDFYKAKL